MNWSKLPLGYNMYTVTSREVRGGPIRLNTVAFCIGIFVLIVFTYSKKKQKDQTPADVPEARFEARRSVIR